MYSITCLLHRIILFLAFLLACSAILSAQQEDSLHTAGYFEEHFIVTGRDSVVALANEFILAGSERLDLDSLALRGELQYRIDRRYGKIMLKDSVLMALKRDSSSLHRLVV